MKLNRFILYALFFSTTLFANESHPQAEQLELEKQRLITVGVCEEDDFAKRGGWKKSIVEPDPNVYYVHCGNNQVSRRTHYFTLSNADS